MYIHEFSYVKPSFLCVSELFHIQRTSTDFHAMRRVAIVILCFVLRIRKYHIENCHHFPLLKHLPLIFLFRHLNYARFHGFGACAFSIQFDWQTIVGKRHIFFEYDIEVDVAKSSDVNHYK